MTSNESISGEVFQLRDIRPMRSLQPYVERGTRKLNKLTKGLKVSEEAAADPLVDILRERFRDATMQGKSFDWATDVKRKQWALLKLYLTDLDEKSADDYLPEFNENLVVWALGSDKGRVKKHLLRLATYIFFTHFASEHLKCLKMLAAKLQESWQALSSARLAPDARVWSQDAERLFLVDGPVKVAKAWEPGIDVDALIDSYQIPEGSSFHECVLELVLLHRLRTTSLQEPDEELAEQLGKQKERIMQTGSKGRLGAAAVKILVERSMKEGLFEVPDAWKEEIVHLACDPRTPNSQEQAKWWGWASQQEKDVAIRSMAKLTIEKFIRLLELSLKGTANEHQFPARKRFLLNLFKLGKVIDARLVMGPNLKDAIDSKTRKSLSPGWIQGGGDRDRSYICLRCIDEVMLVEGTHSFALRGYVGLSSFPIQRFWENSSRSFSQDDFVVPKWRCTTDVYQIHHQGDWVYGVVSQLREYHIDWRGLR